MLMKTSIFAGFVSTCSLNASAIPSQDDVRTEISEYLLRKGAVESLHLVDRRGACASHLMGANPSSELLSYEAIVSKDKTADKMTFLICVEVETDGTLNIEYFPED